MAEVSVQKLERHRSTAGKETYEKHGPWRRRMNAVMHLLGAAAI